MTRDDCQSCQHRLQNKSLFSCLPSSQFAELEKHRSTRDFVCGQVLFFPDDEPFGVYCLRQGLVKLEAFSADGKTQLLRLARPGEPLGYRAYLNSKKQKYQATAVTDARVCALPQAYLAKILEEVPEFSQALLKRLSSDLEFSEERWLGLMQKNSRQRVAELLLEFHNIKGPWPSRRDMAQLVDMTPETFSRVLREFERQGWLTRTRKSLEILSPESLHSVVNDLL